MFMLEPVLEDALLVERDEDNRGELALDFVHHPAKYQQEQQN